MKPSDLDAPIDRRRLILSRDASDLTGTKPDDLHAAPGSTAESIGWRFRTHRPIACGLVLWFLGYLALSAVIVGLGLLLTHVLLDGSLGRWDESVSRWFVATRTGTLDSVTSVGSALGSTIVIVGGAVLTAIMLAIGRHRRQIGFLVCALTLEFAVFLTATLLIDRPRPAVPRLDPSPVTSSYPSGHTAAAIVLFGGIALVTSSLVRSQATRIFVWIVAVAIPLFVGFSRLYRGMHHATDLAASLILGMGALSLALLTTRATTTVSALREKAPRDPAASSTPRLGVSS
jgi:membrane-associated phospholipid phosphatase